MGAGSLLPGLAEGAETTTRSGGPGGSGVRFTWFGTNGWEIAFGNRTILVDPWFGRFDTGFLTGKFDASTPITTESSPRARPTSSSGRSPGYAPKSR